MRLPDEEKKAIGIWGQRHLEYLKQHRKGIYINLLTSGRLNTYLADIDRQAQRVTEQLKEENALEWTGKMNNIRICVREIINSEIIYV